MDVHFKALSLHPSSFFPLFSFSIPSLRYSYCNHQFSFCIITSEHNCFWSGDSLTWISSLIMLSSSSSFSFSVIPFNLWYFPRFLVQSTSASPFTMILPSQHPFEFYFEKEGEYKDYRCSLIPFFLFSLLRMMIITKMGRKRMEWRGAKYIHSSQWSQNQKGVSKGMEQNIRQRKGWCRWWNGFFSLPLIHSSVSFLHSFSSAYSHWFEWEVYISFHG